MRVCSKGDVFVCKARFCPFQPEEACSDKGAEKGNKLTLEQVKQMFGPSTYWSLLLSLSSLALCNHPASSYTVDWTAAAAAAQPAVTPAAVNSPAAMNQKKKKSIMNK